MCLHMKINTCAPFRQVFAVSSELEYPGIAVAIRYVDVPCHSVYSHISGLAEVLFVSAWYEGLSQCHQDLVSTITAQLENLNVCRDRGLSQLWNKQETGKPDMENLTFY